MKPGPTDLVVASWGARFRGRHLPCASGYSGIGEKTREGDGLSPAGRFRIVAVMYRPDRVSMHVPRLFQRRTGLPDLRWSMATPRSRVTSTRVRETGPGDIWSDDPADPAYNRHVSAVDGSEYPYSHERLSRGDPMYDLIAVLDFNLQDPVPGRGSAIFLHAWRGPRYPTAGCIAFPREILAEIIESWLPHSRVFIQG